MNKPLERLRLSQTNRPLDVIHHWHERGELLLDPPYQRGDVWGNRRRVNLIRSIMLGVPIPSIIINDRFSAGWQDDLSMAVIDGKQRITTILMFFRGELHVPGEWFGHSSEVVTLKDLPLPQQRGFRHTPAPFSEGHLTTLEMEQEVFDLVNFGGIPQGESDTTP